MRKQKEIIKNLKCNYTKSLRGWIFLLGTLFVVLFPALHASAATQYVDAGIGTSGDGTSWATAFETLFEAVTAASSGDQIWMKGGTYYPTWVYFDTKNNISVYGGFNGTETELSQRDLGAAPTILDCQNATYNSPITVYSSATGIVLDGLTVTNYSGSQSAVRIAGDTVIRYCYFTYNTTTASGSVGYYGGAAMKISGGSPVITNCIFAHNTAASGYGGAVHLNISSADFINCTFVDNTAINGGAIGIYGDNGPNHEIYNCLFFGNTGTPSPDIYYYSGYNPTTSNNYYYWEPADPLLVDPDNGNYHISPGSPCIDAGSGSYSLTSIDIDGDSRVIDGTENGSAVVDIGADEFDPSQDYYADLYVDSTKSDDSGDGTSWATAKKTIQGAIDAASAGNEIWVRTGTYGPVEIDAAVVIYGGFAGSEIQRASRNIVSNPTTINGQASSRCVDISAAAVLNGFIITNGSSAGGSGILIGNSGAVVSNCIIDSNVSSGYGGGVYFSSPATIEDCEITNNTAISGAGIYNGFVNSTIDSCLIEGNSASGSGGGIYNDGGFAPVITGSIIKDNHASNNGGGIFNDEKNDAIITMCTILLNTASSRGGGIYSGQESSSNTSYAQPDITNNIIANNWATWGGGLYCAAYSKPEIINNTIAGNTAATGGAGVYVVDYYSYTRIMNSILYGNVLDGGGHSDIYYNGPSVSNLALLYNNFSALIESWHNAGAPSRVGNIAVYAGFINYNGIDGDPLAGGDSDYDITSASEVVDQGITSATISTDTLTAPDIDIEGNPRPQGTGVDLGAYESGYSYVPSYTIEASASPTAGGSVSCSPNPVDDGYASTCAITTNTGYGLDSVTGTCGGSLDSDTFMTAAITADCTVIANFSALVTHDITTSASPSEGGSVTCSPDPVADGSTSECTVVTSSGYSLDDVTGTCGGSLEGDTYTTGAVTTDCTVDASFTLNQYMITTSVLPVEGGEVNCDPNPVDHGSSAACTISAGTGYTLDEVGGTCSGDLDGATYTIDSVTGACTVNVDFTINTYTVTASVSGGNGTISPSGDSIVDYGDEEVYTLEPASGYHIDRVTGTCGGDLDGDTFTTSAVTADCNVIASFSDQYTLSIMFEGDGTGSVTMTPSDISCTGDCTSDFDPDTVVTLTAEGGQGEFTGWSGEGCSGTDECVVTMDQARQVTATFKEDFPWSLFMPAIQGSKSR